MTPPAGAKVAYVWDIQGQLCWFHYTTIEYAETMASARRYAVSASQHQKRGSGLFVTTRNPLELTEAELLTELFAFQRPPDAVEAVVVLRRDEKVLQTKKVGHTSHLHSAPPGTEVDLAPLYLGYGIRREGAPSGWLLDKGLYVAKTPE